MSGATEVRGLFDHPDRSAVVAPGAPTGDLDNREDAVRAARSTDPPNHLVGEALVAVALGVDHRLISPAHPGRDPQPPHHGRTEHHSQCSHQDTGRSGHGGPFLRGWNTAPGRPRQVDYDAPRFIIQAFYFWLSGREGTVAFNDDHLRRVTAARPAAAATRRPGRAAGTGPSTTRADILAAARMAVADWAMSAPPCAPVATRAGVNQALIYHFFGSKDQLFAADPESAHRPALHHRGATRQPRTRGRRTHSTRLGRVAPSRCARTLPSSAASRYLPPARPRTCCANLFTRELLDAFAATTARPDAQLRAALVASQIAGIAMLRSMIGIDALADADDETIVNAVGPTLQRYLTGVI